MLNSNIIRLTDSYKLSHAPQYPDGTRQVHSYFEARQGAQFGMTTFFGLQYLIKRYLAGPVVTQEKIEEAQELSDKHVGPGIFNRAGWDYILKEFGGNLPVRIRAVKEGMQIPTDNVLMTVENTDPDSRNPAFWLTNYIETLLTHVWYPSTVASLSAEARRVLLRHLEKSGTPENIDFMLHDFGVRGATCMEAAAIGGAAHLINFKGTDNVPSLELIEKYYGSSDMPGLSIPATEHSTITSHGEENELETYRRLTKIYPKGLLACVSDSWDIYEACRMWAGPLKEDVLGRDGKTVVRPDSGEPKEVDPECVRILGEGFGLTKNDKGYLTLHPQIGTIQGDGCSLPMMDEVLTVMEDEHNQSSDNICFGMGGGLLQKLNRDTQRFAFKCSSINVNGEERDVSKNPKTDTTKRSKGGKLALIRDGWYYRTVRKADGIGDLMDDVFENGTLLRDQNFDDVRKLSKACRN